MPVAIALPIRTYIVEQHQQGHPLSQIAAELQLSYWSVRRLWRCYRDAGMAGLSLGYGRCGRRGVRSERLLYRSAVWLKRHHPSWGAGLIHALLTQRYPHFPLPHPRTFQRWWVQAGVQTRVRSRRLLAPVPPQIAQQVHQVWQLDATSHARLADGSGASWLSVVDEYSGALLESAVFPHYVFESVPVEAVQQSLRRIFAHWGLPRVLRVDNGQPWGSRSDLPSQLTLWLLGLGVEVRHNRPYHPTENARVERSHSTMKAWVEPQRCANLSLLQQRLDEAARLQREVYPALGGRARAQAYPQLATNPRAYQPQHEPQQWRIERVLAYLRAQRWLRQVDAGGRISLFNRNYFVSRRQAGQRVYVRVDPEQVAWRVENQQGQVLARPACPQLCARTICQLEVLYREPSRPRRGA